jgi:hypothetical protein
MHMIQSACNLRYKDAYTSCYICLAKCKKCAKETIHMLQKSSHTKLTNHRLLEGRQKGLDTTGKRAKERKTHKLPLNTCTRAKKHTKLTLHTRDSEGAKHTNWLDQGHTLEGHKLTHLDHFLTIHSSLSTIPESDVPSCHHWGMRLENHPRYQPNVLRASHLQLKTKSESEQMTQHWG